MKTLDVIALAVTLVALRRYLPGKTVAGVSAAFMCLYLRKRLRERRFRSLKGKGKVLIIGAGAAGLCAAFELKRMGLDVTVIERNSKVGGVWETNTYPGCCADVESYLYQFSFFPRTFSTKWASRDELQQYLSDLASHLGLNELIRLNQRVDKASWDSESNMWSVTFTDTVTGKSTQHSANYLISAAGMLRDAKKPSFPTGEYKGKLMHTAQWDSSVDLKGKNVAIVGTGSSGVQAASAILKDVKSLTVYMRTPPYTAPKVNHSTSPLKRFLFDNSDTYLCIKRFMRKSFLDLLMWLVFSNRFPTIRQFVTRKLFDNKASKKIHSLIPASEIPQKLKELVPSYPLGCKRICVDNDWVATMCSNKTEIVNSSIERLTSEGVQTCDKTRSHDVVVLATGFYNTKYCFPIEIIGQDGTSLSDTWQYDSVNCTTSPCSYLGVTVPGFPNFFVLNGPSTNPFNSIWLAIEAQVKHIKLLVSHLSANNLSHCQPTHSAAARFERDLKSDFHSTVFSDPRCKNVFHPNGWPGSWCRPFTSYDTLMETIKQSDWVFN